MLEVKNISKSFGKNKVLNKGKFLKGRPTFFGFIIRLKF